MKKIFLLFLLLFILSSYGPPKRLWTAIGDSITYMNEHPEETDNRVSSGYMKIVTSERPGLEYINKGYNGWTSGGIAENIEKLGLVKSDIYSVFLGTNDWWAGRPVGVLSDYIDNKGNKTVYGSFRIIINKLRSLNPKAQIILITPMQRLDFVYIKNANNNAWGSYKQKNGQSLEQFAEVISTIGKKEGLQVIDLYHNKHLALKHLVKFKRLPDPNTGEYKNYKYPDFKRIPFDPSKDEYPYPREAMNMTYDGLHPSDKGNKEIAKTLLKVIKK